MKRQEVIVLLNLPQLLVLEDALNCYAKQKGVSNTLLKTQATLYRATDRAKGNRIGDYYPLPTRKEKRIEQAK